MIENLDDLQNMAIKIENILKKRNEVRDNLIKISREAIKYSGQCIQSIHMKKLENARNLIKKAEDIHLEILRHIREEPSFIDSGFVSAAFQEYAEAKLLLGIIEQNKIPSYTELDVSEAAYILGIADLIGELRRYVLETLVLDDVETAKNHYALMKELYRTFLHIDIGKNIVSDFRRKKDTARILIERTLSDLFVAIQGKRIETKLKQL